MWKRAGALWIVLAAILMSVSGCVNGSHAPSDSAPFCALYEPIYTTVSEQAALSDQTMLSIDRNNAAWLELCEGDGE